MGFFMWVYHFRVDWLSLRPLLQIKTDFKQYKDFSTLKAGVRNPETSCNFWPPRVKFLFPGKVKNSFYSGSMQCVDVDQEWALWQWQFDSRVRYPRSHCRELGARPVPDQWAAARSGDNREVNLTRHLGRCHRSLITWFRKTGMWHYYKLKKILKLKQKEKKF